MLTLFKKLFGKSKPAKVAVSAAVSRPVQQEASAPIPTVEVAQLSLAAIVARLPDDIKSLVRQQPPDAATVALPIQIIVKQLPSGTVKMSLASLHRQSPTGVFSPIPPGDKRMVSIPLGEIFRHVSPYVLKRRGDQRPASLPDDGITLFGSAANPYEIVEIGEHAPTRPASVAPDAPRCAPLPGTPADGQRVIAPPSDYFAPAQPAATPEPAPVAPPFTRKHSDVPPLRLPLAPLVGGWPDEIRGELAALNGSAAILLPTEDVTAGLAKGKVAFTWGEIRAYLEPALETPSAVADETPLNLPLKFVAPAFLAASKGSKPEARKVTVAADIPALFSGGHAPALEPPTAPAPVMEATPVVEPAPVVEAEASPVLAAPVGEPELPVVAEPEPLASEEPAAPVASEAAPPLAFELAPPSAPEPAHEPAPAIVFESEPPAVTEPAPAFVLAEAPPIVFEQEAAVVTEPESSAIEEPASVVAIESEPAVVAEAAPAFVLEETRPLVLEQEPPIATEPPAVSAGLLPPPAPVIESAPAVAPSAPGKLPETLGEIFGEPDRKHWTPADIVARVSQLPGIAGAVVALQEGLLVAQSLPEDVKGEVVAAFLPQIFARLNIYSGEMKLGELDDLLFTTRGAHCQIYRLGFVYFAVLGKRGESLPWHELRIIAEELAKETQPA